MKKSLALAIIVIIVLSAMIVRINNQSYTPFNTQKQLAHTNYKDNLDINEKADIGLLGITSVTGLINTVTRTYGYAEKVVKTITNFLDSDKVKKNIKDWFTIPLPILPKMRW